MATPRPDHYRNGPSLWLILRWKLAAKYRDWGIRRVKGAKRLGVRFGNWLTIDQSRTLLGQPSDSLRGKRDRAILALLIGCGLRRAELVGLRTGDFQVREEHCVIADLVGKGKHIRTVPVPLWANAPSMSDWGGCHYRWNDLPQSKSAR